MKVNVNQQVLIRETKIGKDIYDTYYTSIKLDPEIYRKMQSQPDGRLKMELWQVMQVYGRAIGMGFAIPFETEIEILPL
jgi:hypothetical protein